MFDDIFLEPIEDVEEEIVLWDADEQEDFEREVDEIQKGLLSDDEQESDEAMLRLLNIGV